MNCAILSIGTELLFGSTINTNTVYLSQQLNQLGFNVLLHHTVGDNQHRLIESLDYLFNKVDMVIVSGGLGPTEDDLTKETICKFFETELVMNNEVLLDIENYFRISKRIMPPNNRKQALVPRNSHLFINEIGTAPGFAIEDSHRIIIAMPGPPKEMMHMFENHVKEYITALNETRFFSRHLRFFGIGEGDLEYRLRSLIHGQSDPTYATYAKDGQCTLRITSKDFDISKAEERVEKALLAVKELVGEYLYSIENEELPVVVGKKLIERDLTISSCESCTGGMFTEMLTNVPGISKVFKESFVTYSNQAKIDILGVKESTIAQYTEVSQETALEMVLGLHERTNCDIGVSITGFAGPTTEYDDIPVGTVYIGLYYNGVTNVTKLELNDNGRQWIRNYSSLAMFDIINKALQ